jgi:hypothetical protein
MVRSRRHRGCSLMLFRKREGLDACARDDRVGRPPSASIDRLARGELPHRRRSGGRRGPTHRQSARWAGESLRATRAPRRHDRPDAVDDLLALSVLDHEAARGRWPRADPEIAWTACKGPACRPRCGAPSPPRHCCEHGNGSPLSELRSLPTEMEVAHVVGDRSVGRVSRVTVRVALVSAVTSDRCGWFWGWRRADSPVLRRLSGLTGKPCVDRRRPRTFGGT